MEEKNIFSILCFIISRKVKMQLKHTHKKICAGYEEGAVTDWRCQKWFSEFCAGDFSLDDIPQSSRPVKLTAVKHNNGEQWMLHQQETADILKISKSINKNQLHQLGCFLLCVDSTQVKQRKKKFLDRIPHGNSLLHVTKIFFYFKTTLIC